MKRLALVLALLLLAVPCQGAFLFVRLAVKPVNTALSVSAAKAAQSVQYDIIDMVDDGNYPKGCADEGLLKSRMLAPNGGPYAALHIPKLSVAEYRKYITPELDANGDVVQYRIWRLLWDSLTREAQEALTAKGCYQTTLDAVKTTLYDKVNLTTDAAAVKP
jgi:hypothetical protein